MGTRVAVVSDVHGSLTALEAVIADLGETTPDVVLHGGDLADAGASPAAVIDRIRELGWRGVMGNTDEMLHRPESLPQFSAPHPELAPMFAKIAEMAAWTRTQLGPDRLEWLRAQPASECEDDLALVHASPGDAWRAPRQDASDADLRATYGPLSRPVVVYGHTHVPFVRKLAGLTVVNSGSAGQPHDGDPRASYVIADGGQPVIRRVAYDLDHEVSRLRRSDLPHAEWIVRTLTSGRPQLP
ncbi:MAG: metallophosphoesterase family protein [Actinobacteria bacterium]|nr:metallophosphoesterase family protein [Actinomycetota bacterium]